MSRIDFTQMITAEDKAATASAERVSAVKAQCRARIFAAASQSSQMNLTAAASSSRLNPEQAATWNDALQWVDDMRATCAPLIADTEVDYTADAPWPDLPEGVADLIAQF